MAVTFSSVAPRPLPPGPGLAVDLVAGAELVLADDPLADVDVAVGGQVSRLAPPEKAGALPASSRTPSIRRRRPRSA